MSRKATTRERHRKERECPCGDRWIRREHWFLDALWYYIHILYYFTVIVSNLTVEPTQTSDGSCSHGNRIVLVVAYMVAVVLQFLALIIIFVSPLYQIMKTKKRLFRNVFSHINIRRKKSRNPGHSRHSNTGAMQPRSKNITIQTGDTLSDSPAQREFLSRIKGQFVFLHVPCSVMI